MTNRYQLLKDCFNLNIKSCNFQCFITSVQSVRNLNLKKLGMQVSVSQVVCV